MWTLLFAIGLGLIASFSQKAAGILLFGFIFAACIRHVVNALRHRVVVASGRAAHMGPTVTLGYDRDARPQMFWLHVALYSSIAFFAGWVLVTVVVGKERSDELDNRIIAFFTRGGDGVPANKALQPTRK